jgi:quinoprotein glucose dehydrogenase
MVKLLRVSRALAVAGIISWAAAPTHAQFGARNGEWPYWGGDAANTHYSPLDQINRANVKNLRIAWRWKGENFGPRPEYNFEVTPLMVGGALYLPVGSRPDVVAIDAASGENLWMWRFDEGDRGRDAPWHHHRGLSYWTDHQGDDRILAVTSGYQLVALNAKNGRLYPDFGKNGIVDLYEGLDRPVPQNGLIGLTSPPIVVGDVVVVGASLQDGSVPKSRANVAGFIRGYDVRTGRRLWIFHTIPQPGEFGNDTWEKDSWSYTGNTGVWAPMSADEQLNYVYLPVETPTSDFYGGHRPGNNLFANSLVCIDAKTGKRIWHFQLTHHEIWDFDIASAPNLIDITVGGRSIRAVAQVSKQAFTYVFDRVTGEPVWPILEKPVPQSDVPGERTSPTQPFPTRPAPFDRQGVTSDDLIDFTPEIKAEALKIAKQYRSGPLYTPASVYDPNGTRGTLILPNFTGGASWHGAAVDPESGTLYVPSATIEQAIALVHDAKRSDVDYIRLTGAAAGAGPAAGGQPPFGSPLNTGLVMPGPLRPFGLPLFKPPWGRITAIDLNSGEHSWMVPNSDTPPEIRNHPALKGVDIPKTGTPERSGLLVTKTLLFAGEGGGVFATPRGAGGPWLRAIDKKTGEVIYQFKLPANQNGLPMTYMAGGKQYIAVAVAAPGAPGELVALTVD